MLFYFACEAAGASAPGIPHALLMERRKILAHLGRIRAAGSVTDLPRDRCDKRKAFAHGSAGECHSPCHRPRRRAIQYCRGADDQSTGRGVLDTRFRGYDGGAYDERDLFAHASAAKQSSFFLSLTMDCFAALAMTPTGLACEPGPIATGSSLCRCRPTASLNTSDTAYWVLAAGTTLILIAETTTRHPSSRPRDNKQTRLRAQGRF